jgi:transcriptional regulator GlxA family with amidase domain
MSFGILIYPGVEELDFQGPWEMVGMWHKYARGPKPLLLARSLDPVTCAHGMRVLPDTTLADAPAR